MSNMSAPHGEAAMQRTLSIIKPDACRRNLHGRILWRLETEGFRIAACRRLQLTPRQAAAFYHVHLGRPFFASLCAFMSSGPIMASVLERENAIAHYRKVIGATDPAKASAGTIRADFGQSVEANAVHGSDSPQNAQQEIAFFFSALDLVSD